jgi:methyl-accepting chemotaxis protein
LGKNPVDKILNTTVSVAIKISEFVWLNLDPQLKQAAKDLQVDLSDFAAAPSLFGLKDVVMDLGRVIGFTENFVNPITGISAWIQDKVGSAVLAEIQKETLDFELGELIDWTLSKLNPITGISNWIQNTVGPEVTKLLGLEKIDFDLGTIINWTFNLPGTLGDIIKKAFGGGDENSPSALSNKSNKNKKWDDFIQKYINSDAYYRLQKEYDAQHAGPDTDPYAEYPNYNFLFDNQSTNPPELQLLNPHGSLPSGVFPYDTQQNRGMSKRGLQLISANGQTFGQNQLGQVVKANPLDIMARQIDQITKNFNVLAKVIVQTTKDISVYAKSIMTTVADHNVFAKTIVQITTDNNVYAKTIVQIIKDISVYAKAIVTTIKDHNVFAKTIVQITKDNNTYAKTIVQVTKDINVLAKVTVQTTKDNNQLAKTIVQLTKDNNQYARTINQVTSNLKDEEKQARKTASALRSIPSGGGFSGFDGGGFNFAKGGIISAAGGFTTNGRQLIMVGDNPGGHETVAAIPNNAPSSTMGILNRRFGTGGSEGSIVNQTIQLHISGNDIINERNLEKRIKLTVGENRDRFG